MHIIGLSGRAGAGKDWITEHILKPDGYFQISFAWHFKIWMVSTGEATYEEVFVTKPPHIRKKLQRRGTEEGRNVYGENIWCQTALAWMRLLHDTNGVQKFVIPDIRFPNELEFVQQQGGLVFRINAPTRTANSNLTPEAREHISETALDHIPPTGFDGIIQNDPAFATTLSYQVHRLLRGTPTHMFGSY